MHAEHGVIARACRATTPAARARCGRAACARRRGRNRAGGRPAAPAGRADNRWSTSSSTCAAACQRPSTRCAMAVRWPLLLRRWPEAAWRLRAPHGRPASRPARCRAGAATPCSACAMTKLGALGERRLGSRQRVAGVEAQLAQAVLVGGERRRRGAAEPMPAHVGGSHLGPVLFLRRVGALGRAIVWILPVRAGPAGARGTRNVPRDGHYLLRRARTGNCLTLPTKPGSQKSQGQNQRVSDKHPNPLLEHRAACAAAVVRPMIARLPAAPVGRRQSWQSQPQRGRRSDASGCSSPAWST